MLLRVMRFVALWPCVSCKRHLDPAFRQYLYDCLSPMIDVGAVYVRVDWFQTLPLSSQVSMAIACRFVLLLYVEYQGLVVPKELSAQAPRQRVLSTIVSDVQSDADTIVS